MGGYIRLCGAGCAARIWKTVISSPVRAGVVFVLLLTTGAPMTAVADIYMYTDEDGVIHFSNTPTSGKYKLYMRERKRVKKGKVRTDLYDPLIEKASKKNDVEFPLVKAIIRVESNFNPRAVSRKGARGLMQIMPQNYESLRITDPFDPGENIMGGSRYLRKMLNRFDGEVSLALAAYNAGPTQVETHKGIPPFRETRDYVKKVLKYYSIYRR